MRSPPFLLVPALALGLAATGATAAPAQRVNPTRLLDVTMDLGTQTLSAVIREGGSLRVIMYDRDEYELVPVVLDPAARKVAFAVYLGTKDQPDTRRMVERLGTRVGEVSRLRTNSQFSLVVDRIRTAPARTQPAAPIRRTSFRSADVWREVLQDPDQCCVCCGSSCACACGVIVSCGRCCMDECCDQMPPPIRPSTSAEGEALAKFAAFFGSGCDRGFAAGRAQGAVASR